MMDTTSVLSLVIVLLIGVLGFIGKRTLDEIKKLREDFYSLREDFSDHKLNDAVSIARLEEKVDRSSN